MVTSAETSGEILFGKTRRAVLGLLFLRPTERFHLRQIERLTGVGIGALQREIKSLAAAGLVRRENEGNHSFYRADPESPVFEIMKDLVLRTIGVGLSLRHALEPVSDAIAAAYLFGSLAQGRQHANSDVDILIVSDSLSLREVVTRLAPLQEKLGREINPVIYRSAEFRKKLRANHPFLSRVKKEPKLLLMGESLGFG